ncbi:DUF6882 domain-containing protein [Gordonia aurantiaca]|uniref:DUF6882 domain-containing protein n=1 Tax=Gordonia sp. B21 TaxID=3151852 RepID=UPI003267068B
MQFDGLHAVADYAALYTALRQAALVDFLCARLGSFDVRCDSDRRTVVFSSTRPDRRDRVIRSKAALVAVVAPHDVVWGWSLTGDGEAGPTSALRDTVARLGLDETGAVRADLPSGVATSRGTDDAEDPDGVVDLIAAAAVESTGISPHCTVPLDGHARALFLLEGLPVPEPSFADFATRLPMVLDSLAVRDHRVAIHGMAARRGWHISWRTGSDRGRSPICDVTDGRSVAHVDFDRRGRPVGYRCRLAAAD